MLRSLYYHSFKSGVSWADTGDWDDKLCKKCVRRSVWPVFISTNHNIFIYLLHFNIYSKMMIFKVILADSETCLFNFNSIVNGGSSCSLHWNSEIVEHLLASYFHVCKWILSVTRPLSWKQLSVKTREMESASSRHAQKVRLFVFIGGLWPKLNKFTGSVCAGVTILILTEVITAYY